MNKFTKSSNDLVGLPEYIHKVERLCRYSDITILLYRNSDGLFLNEIVSAVGDDIDKVLEAIDILVRDDMIEEDKNRQFYILSDTATQVFDLYENDATITLESRLSEISNLLGKYSLAKKTGEKQTMDPIGDDTTRYLYKTYKKTRSELKHLKDKVESEYKIQRNLHYKAELLKLYIKNIEDIMYALDVKRPTGKDAEGNTIIFRNLRQMLNDDQDYGADYKLEIEGFFKNCDASLSEQILELYHLFRTWWGKTKVALEDVRLTSQALGVLIKYNAANTAVTRVLDNYASILPPVFRRLPIQSEDGEESVSIDINNRIMSLESVNRDDYHLISSSCAKLKYDFKNFCPLEEQPIPEEMLAEEPEFEYIYNIKAEIEIEEFKKFKGTLLEFLRMRYQSITEEQLLRTYMRIALRSGKKPIIFDSAYDAELIGERFNEEYDIITIKNKISNNNEQV